ncbi:DODA-type extradiol aromatic ring-opening family dioxygenase [Halomonas salinarum]|uniref:DODA-type extradiol aromatic ring-opening family dioxygenase n=1 Tax=Halomonas salinarum TaxID=1158993 RepID=UPI00143BEE43|nr:class III extradiol ring-cleavage dioxygenase [Halomonas salinarum]
MTTSSHPLPTVFLPHGAGPCFFMDWQPAGLWEPMAAWLGGLTESLKVEPRAILVISAHWQADTFTVNAQSAPSLYYDYYGFPDHTYHLSWPAQGDPALAAEVREQLAEAGIASAEEHHRGLDHGVFIPLKLVFPKADVPVVQLSLKKGLDPDEHLALGRVLAPLREQGVLIIGSGMSYHNMARFKRGDGPVDPDSRAFDAWLSETVALPGEARASRLRDWATAPGGRESHPEEEHLLPLFVAAAAGGEAPGVKAFEDEVMGSVQSAFVFGASSGQAT